MTEDRFILSSTQSGFRSAEKREKATWRQEKRQKLRANKGGTDLNRHGRYCVAKCRHIAMQCFKNTRKIWHWNATTAMQKPKKMMCLTMKCLKKCTTSSPSWEYGVHKSIVAWGKSSQPKHPLYTERNLLHHCKDHTLLRLHLPTSRYGESKASSFLKLCTASVIVRNKTYTSKISSPSAEWQALLCSGDILYKTVV